MRDAQDVLVTLGRQSNQKVELDALPTVRKRRIGGRKEVLFADEFVDHATHAPRATLGSEGQSPAASLLQCGRGANGKRVNTQARQRNRYAAAA